MSYRVSFFKVLLNSNGHQFRCLQQSIMIRRARSAERAVEAAKRRFERLCHLADWRLYADGVELEDQLGLSAQHVSRNERGSAAGAPPARRSKAPAGKLRAGIGGTSSMSGD
jgi:hypothetical protein